MPTTKVQVVVRKANGWCIASVTRAGNGDGAQVHDTVAIHEKYGFVVGDVLEVKLVPSKKGGYETWFATWAAKYSPPVSHVYGREDWQIGHKPITVPDTMAGSLHEGIEFECWKCGGAKVHGNQIHRVKQTAIWTNTDRLDCVIISDKKAFNKYKRCSVQSALCGNCKTTLGSFYAEPYYDDETAGLKAGQPFPCLKLDHVRKAQDGEPPRYSLVLTGSKWDVEKSISLLATTADAEFVQRFAQMGRVDGTSWELLREHKEREAKLAAQEEKARRDAEEERRRAKADAERTRREAEKKAAEATAAKREVEKQMADVKREAEKIQIAAEAAKKQAIVDAEAAKKAAELEARAIQDAAAAAARAAKNDSEAAKRDAFDKIQEAARRQAEVKQLEDAADKARHEAEIQEAQARSLQDHYKELVVKAEKSLVAPLPKYWTGGITVDTPPKCVDVTESMRQRMEWLMNKTAKPETHGHGRDSHGCDFSTFRVLKVERIESFQRWQLYATKRAQIAADEGSVVKDVMTAPLLLPRYVETKRDGLDEAKNEFYLFHGTKKEIAERVSEEGLDHRLCGGMLGKGVYFAESASKSDQYAGQGVGPGKTLFMFLSRVTMGSQHHTQQSDTSLVRPPCVSACPAKTVCRHQRRDSVLYAGTYFREFVVYDNTQCLPEYLIHYERVQ